MAKNRKNGRKASRHPRRRLTKATVILTVAFALYAAFCDWFVHHPRQWLDAQRERWPEFVHAALLRTGNPVGDLTDALGITGCDCVYEYDTEAPAGEILFAGEPVRTGSPAPTDITVLDRGEFRIGWSKSLRHPVWAAYHVTRDAAYAVGERPDFRKDPSVASSPAAGDYAKSGYDRGHMAPNYAITSRYGLTAQKATFLMTNIAPQRPSLNRAIWRDLEHRIAKLWTARYGEIWVIVGCYSESTRMNLKDTDIDVPERFYMLIVAQEGMDVRALAVDIPQTVGWNDYAARNLISIDELEAKTGLDFLPDLPEFFQSPLEAELPTRLWPICLSDIVDYLRLLAE